jgi:hypothetical protein
MVRVWNALGDMFYKTLVLVFVCPVFFTRFRSTTTSKGKKNAKGLFSQYEYENSKTVKAASKNRKQSLLPGEAKLHSRKGRNTVLMGEKVAGFQFRDGYKPNAPSSKSQHMQQVRRCLFGLPIASTHTHAAFLFVHLGY